MRGQAVAVLALTAGLLLASGPAASEAMRVLAVFPFAAHSHNTMFKGMAEALVDHGHEVVMFSPFPRRTPRANWTDVDTSGPTDLLGSVDFAMLKVLPFHPPVLTSMLIPFMAMRVIAQMGGTDLCRRVFAMPELQRAVAGGYGRFDVVLTEAFASDCWAAIPHLMKLPNVALASGPDWPWIHDRMGSVDNPSYLVNSFINLTEPMPFMGRVENTVFTATINYAFKRTMQDAADEVVREFFGEGVPPLRELVKNTSLLLLNRHHSVNVARPFPPNIVPVGGLHIAPPPNTLEASLREFMDGAEHGVIYFSLGSMVKASSMPAAMRDKFLWAFSQLPQRVVWKFEANDFPVPDNVRVSKWLPQMDVLTHPNTKLFITHGGLMGTLESLYTGTPMLGLPLYADQWSNMYKYQELGIAEQMDHQSMTKESILADIKKTLGDRYRERSREMAALFKDRPRQSAEEAVWWVEYVVRNGGEHLRPRSVHMPWWEYHLVDVLLFLAVLALLVIASAVAVLVWVARRIAARMGSPPKAKKA